MSGNEFENHIVFSKIEQLRSRINSNELKDSLGIEDLNFFETSTAYILDKLRYTIPILIQEADLTTITQEIENALIQINNFTGNKNYGHITNAKNNIFNSIIRVRNLPFPLTKNDYNFSKNISIFEKIVKDKHKSLEDENEILRKKLTELNTELKNNKIALRNIKSTLDSKLIEIQTLNSNFKTEFDTIKVSANQNYDTDRQTFKIEFESLKIALKNEIDNLKNNINSDSTQVINELNNRLIDAKKIVGVIADVSVTGNYQQIANSNKKNADILRVIAISLMLLLSALLIKTIWDLNSENYDWIKSLIRILAAAALSYPATYAARESTKHRRLEILNRKAELELAAINPFIELLPEIKKQEIKEKLVEKYFGNNSLNIEKPENEKGDEALINSVDKLLNTIFSNFRKQ